MWGRTWGKADEIHKNRRFVIGLGFCRRHGGKRAGARKMRQELRGKLPGLHKILRLGRLAAELYRALCPGKARLFADRRLAVRRPFVLQRKKKIAFAIQPL
jgi:hypothetical protein